jgi:hypothetical protein
MHPPAEEDYMSVVHMCGSVWRWLLNFAKDIPRIIGDFVWTGGYWFVK